MINEKIVGEMLSAVTIDGAKRELRYMALLTFRETRRDQVFAQHGDDWRLHLEPEETTELRSPDPRTDLERKFLEHWDARVTRRLSP